MHTIRLRPPWESSWQIGPEQKPWIHYLRRFHSPTGLTPDQRVALNIQAPAITASPNTITACLQIRINETPIEIPQETADAISIPIQQHLLPSNRVCLLLDPDKLPSHILDTESVGPPSVIPQFNQLLRVELQISG